MFNCHRYFPQCCGQNPDKEQRRERRVTGLRVCSCRFPVAGKQGGRNGYSQQAGDPGSCSHRSQVAGRVMDASAQPLFGFLLFPSADHSLGIFIFTKGLRVSVEPLWKSPHRLYLELHFVGDSKSSRADIEINRHSEFLCGKHC